MSNASTSASAERHPLQDIQRTLDATHPGIGRAVCFALVCAMARRTLLVIAPRGTGKSTVSALVGKALPQSRIIKSLTSAGLAPLQEALSSYRGCLIIDDLGAMNTDYMRSRTITTLAELVYTGRVEEHTGHQHVEITEFRGSTIVNCQPVVYKRLLNMPEWEATAEDKTIRYYHLHRPTLPNMLTPVMDVDTNLEMHKVEMPDLGMDGIPQLLDVSGMQWGPSRSMEHVTALLRATAALRLSTTVSDLDVNLLSQLMRPCWLERRLVEKAELDGARVMDSNILYLLTEFVSYGHITIKRLMRNYSISESGAYRVMDRYEKLWKISTKRPETIYEPNEDTARLMRQIG